MSEQELAAPMEAADDLTVSAETEAPEAAENTEGQVESQPAEADAEEKSKSKARRERREAAERRSREEAERASVEAKTAKERLSRVEAALAGLKEPVENDFNDPIVYATAKALWLSKREDRTVEADAARADIQKAEAATVQAEGQRIAALKRDFDEALPDAKARYTDFDAVMNQATIPQGLAVLILEGERPHDLAYHLGKHPELNARILSMSPVAQARELGRIEASLARDAAKPVTTAPAPINPVRGTTRPSSDPAKMSPSEYRAWREAGGKF